MKASSSSERAEAFRIAARAEHVAQLCGKMDEFDSEPSQIGRESDFLTNLIRHVRIQAEAKQIRFPKALRLFELILDLQEEAIADRCAELGVPKPTV